MSDTPGSGTPARSSTRSGPGSDRRSRSSRRRSPRSRRASSTRFTFLDPTGARAGRRSRPTCPAVRWRAHRHQGARRRSAGWPHDRGARSCSPAIATETYDRTCSSRSRATGAVAVPVGQTPASEFGGLNVSINKLHGTCHNPWQHGTVGRRVVGRVGVRGRRRARDDRHRRRRRRLDPHPGGFNGLVGMKGTAGRIPRGPHTADPPDDRRASAAMARSVRDVVPLVRRHQRLRHARPVLAPDASRAGSATSVRYDLRGKQGGDRTDPRRRRSSATRSRQRVRRSGRALAKDAGLELVDVT